MKRIFVSIVLMLSVTLEAQVDPYADVDDLQLMMQEKEEMDNAVNATLSSLSVLSQLSQKGQQELLSKKQAELELLEEAAVKKMKDEQMEGTAAEQSLQKIRNARIYVRRVQKGELRPHGKAMVRTSRRRGSGRRGKVAPYSPHGTPMKAAKR